MSAQTPLLIESQKSLRTFNTWHIGGLAERYACPRSWEELSALLAQLPATEPLTFLGLGSNVLIADEGIAGTVIHTKVLSSDIRVEGDLLWVEAGVTCAKFARYCAEQGWAGATFFAGIPGTMGGAVAMNAGAFGGETWQALQKVLVIDRSGNMQWRDKDAYHIAYRSVLPTTPRQEWFVGACFRFERAEPQVLKTALRALVKKRNASQPIGVFSCGSVFTNPPGDYAARLIEACGLKGYRIGDIQVSDKHANFMVNLGQATAKDTAALMAWVQTQVEIQHGIRLQSEVRFLS